MRRWCLHHASGSQALVVGLPDLKIAIGLARAGVSVVYAAAKDTEVAASSLPDEIGERLSIAEGSDLGPFESRRFDLIVAGPELFAGSEERTVEELTRLIDDGGRLIIASGAGLGADLPSGAATLLDLLYDDFAIGQVDVLDDGLALVALRRTEEEPGPHTGRARFGETIVRLAHRASGLDALVEQLRAGLLTRDRVAASLEAEIAGLATPRRRADDLDEGDGGPSEEDAMLGKLERQFEELEERAAGGDLSQVLAELDELLAEAATESPS